MKFDKDKYEGLKRAAKENNVHVYTRQFNGSTYNGLSVAFAPVLGNGRGKMLWVAVSYCAMADQYSKKIGKCSVLEKFFDFQAIQLPLGRVLKYVGPTAVADNLLDAFAYLS